MLKTSIVATVKASINIFLVSLIQRANSTREEQINSTKETTSAPPKAEDSTATETPPARAKKRERVKVLEYESDAYFSGNETSLFRSISIKTERGREFKHQHRLLSLLDLYCKDTGHDLVSALKIWMSDFLTGHFDHFEDRYAAIDMDDTLDIVLEWETAAADLAKNPDLPPITFYEVNRNSLTGWLDDERFFGDDFDDRLRREWPDANYWNKIEVIQKLRGRILSLPFEEKLAAQNAGFRRIYLSKHDFAAWAYHIEGRVLPNLKRVGAKPEKAWHRQFMKNYRTVDQKAKNAERLKKLEQKAKQAGISSVVIKATCLLDWEHYENGTIARRLMIDRLTKEFNALPAETDFSFYSSKLADFVCDKYRIRSKQPRAIREIIDAAKTGMDAKSR